MTKINKMVPIVCPKGYKPKPWEADADFWHEFLEEDEIMTYSSYRKELISLFWGYQERHFHNWQEYFERSRQPDVRPPVFLKTAAENNIILNPSASTAIKQQVIQAIPLKDRHRWFRSMTSSQALALSIFGNLKINNRLDVLDGLMDDKGRPLFEGVKLSPQNFFLEQGINYLGEPRPTSLDALITGDYKITIECKLSESNIGTCSRPRLSPKDNAYEKEYCNGSYTIQRQRKERCSLTEIGVRYWKCIPGIFKWPNNKDHIPCPIRNHYQLLRNVLAACTRPDGTVSPTYGHAVLLYDNRNPAFKEGGKGFTAFEETREALVDNNLLRKCSWQNIMTLLIQDKAFAWLIDELEGKYGLKPS